MTYSLHYRRKVLKTREEQGLTIAETADLFNIGVASIVRWLKQPEPQKGRTRPWLKIDLHRLAEDIRHFPDAYQYERAARLGVSQRGICDAMKRMHVTYKKISHPSESGRRKTAYLSGKGPNI